MIVEFPSGAANFTGEMVEELLKLVDPSQGTQLARLFHPEPVLFPLALVMAYVVQDRGALRSA